MDTDRIPPSLRERLGHEASAGLVDLLNQTKAECRAEVIGTVADQFERRLTQETAKLRIEMAQGFAALRQEMAQGLAAVRQELAQGLAAVRQELAQGLGAVRAETAQALADFRVEMVQGLANQRTELLKWAFLFWVGQFFAMASLVAILVRALRPGP